ncbi:hypothetical protein POM88_030317 [Heracleum sosnowskyi]|uniref:Uncharacterized protein n=1 Tax=Heracleum sosnowskyi TaxID=360622 RepID=A0AAD8HVD1_9APIA|nr:hypothetical protein POM88_030317 [Heracleum sosnowskyi]
MNDESGRKSNCWNFGVLILHAGTTDPTKRHVSGAFQGLSINEFSGLEFDCQHSFDIQSGEQQLERLSFGGSNSDLNVMTAVKTKAASTESWVSDDPFGLLVRTIGARYDTNIVVRGAGQRVRTSFFNIAYSAVGLFRIRPVWCKSIAKRCVGRNKKNRNGSFGRIVLSGICEVTASALSCSPDVQ